MTDAEIHQTLEKVGALIRFSHIVYTSGRHGSAYVNKDALYPHTRLTSELCREMASQWKSAGIDAVLAPAVGGIILSQWVAFHLSELTGREVLAVYAEKTPDGEGFVVKRGYDRLIAGKQVLLVEDVLTTGGSIKKVAHAVREIGGVTVGLSALCNRGGIKPKDLDVPKLEALVNVSLDSWEEKDCPLCKQGIAVNTEVGKGREFLLKRGT